MLKKYLIKRYFEKADENMILYRNKKAINYLDKILFLDKNNINAIILKSLCYANMLNRTESMKCYELAFKLLPGSDELMIRKGFSYFILEEYELAINCFKKVYNQNSHDIFLLNCLGLAHLYLDEYSEALYYFNKLLKINGNDAKAYVNIGSVYDFQEDYDTAIEYYNIALDIDSKNTMAFDCKADSLLAKGNFSESLQYLNKTLSIRDDLMTKLTKYYVLSYLGEYDKSLQGFKEIKSLEFDDYALIRRYHSYYAKSLVNMGRLDDALKVYDDFLENYTFNEDIKKDRDELFDKIKNQ